MLSVIILKDLTLRCSFIRQLSVIVTVLLVIATQKEGKLYKYVLIYFEVSNENVDLGFFKYKGEFHSGS